MHVVCTVEQETCRPNNIGGFWGFSCILATFLVANIILLYQEKKILFAYRLLS